MTIVDMLKLLLFSYLLIREVFWDKYKDKYVLYLRKVLLTIHSLPIMLSVKSLTTKVLFPNKTTSLCLWIKRLKNTSLFSAKRTCQKKNRKPQNSPVGFCIHSRTICFWRQLTSIHLCFGPCLPCTTKCQKHGRTPGQYLNRYLLLHPATNYKYSFKHGTRHENFCFFHVGLAVWIFYVLYSVAFSTLCLFLWCLCGHR